jgi:hypothetical protein
LTPLKHVVSSAAAGTAFYLLSHSITASFTCFLSGILIDLDHFFDFYRQYKIWPINLKDFYICCIERRLEKVYLLLHSIELIALFWILIIVFRLNLFWLALAAGMTVHIIFDFLGNRGLLFSYSFLYRLKNGFLFKRLFKE